MPDISIIIPTRNRREVLETCLNALLDEINSSVEVLIIDTSSNTETKEIVLRYTQFIYHYIGDIPYSLVISRNYGLKHARGKYIVYIDDDCIVQKNWLSSLVNPLSNPEIVATGGRIIYHPWKTPQKGEPVAILDLNHAKIWAEWDRLVENTIEVSHLPGGNCAIRKEKAQAIGGFDTNFKYSANLEETDFFYRLSKSGGKLLFIPNAVVEHRAAPRQDHLQRFSGNYLWRYSIVRNRIYFFLKHRSYRGLIKSFSIFLLDVFACIYNQIKYLLTFILSTFHGLISGLITHIFTIHDNVTKYRDE